MQVANTTKFVQHFGGVSIEPGRTAILDDEWRSHPVLCQLEQTGLLMVASDPLSREIVERAERVGAFTPPTAPARFEEEPEGPVKINPAVEEKPGHDPTPLEALGTIGDDDLPEGWVDMNTNKANAWIRRCDDVHALGALLETEQRAKVAAALRARLDVLEARP